MLVSEILRIKGHTLFTTPPERSVLEAVEVMAQHDIGSLVVMDHGRMAGMLTFAEVLQALAERRGTLGDAAVADIYEREPLTAAPGLDVMELRRVDARAPRALRAGDGRHDAAGRRVVPRRREGGLRGAELREPHAEELHQGLAGRGSVQPCAAARPLRPTTPAAGTSPAAASKRARSCRASAPRAAALDRFGRRASDRRPRKRASSRCSVVRQRAQHRDIAIRRLDEQLGARFGARPLLERAQRVARASGLTGR